MTQRRTGDRVRVVERNKERGSTLILTALVMPVLVLFAGLGIGGAVVRSSADETQRTASLAAAAAAAQVPTLGRPTYAGLPSVPTDFQTSLPQGVPYNADTTFSPNSVYESELATSAEIDKQIAINTGVGPLFTSALGAIGAPWDKGCRVGEAQYENRRARMSTNFAVAPGRTPKCPVIQADGTAVYPDPDERIYVRPEMESTGAYRLQLCMVNPVNCSLFFGQGAAGVLNQIGTDFRVKFPNFTPGCLIEPTEVGCLFDETTLQSYLDTGASHAQEIRETFDKEFENATGSVDIPDSVEDDYAELSQLLFGQLDTQQYCATGLGPASGQTLCGAGVNLASLLPSVMTPRVRAIARHAIDVPLVPDWANGSDAGDFDFTGHALARRTFKNAVVVPTLPAGFGTQQELCLKGETLLDAFPDGVPVALNTLRSLVASLPVPVSGGVTVSGTPQCPNAEVDFAVENADGTVSVDLNKTLLQQQKALLSAAIRMNDFANDSTNDVIAAALNAEDGGTRSGSNCSTNRTTNPEGPAPWCVDMGGQMIRDVKDVYDPPGNGGAPTAQEVVKGATESGEPIGLYGLAKQIPIELDPPIRMSDGTTVSKLTYWIPALDFVPAIVTCFFDEDAQVYIREAGEPQDADLPCDLDKPFASTFRIVEDVSGPKGLYRAVLLHPEPTAPLCTYPLDSTNADGRCIDQPKATVSVPPILPPTTTTSSTSTSSTSSSSTSSTSSTTSTTSTTTTLLPPILTTLPPTPTTTITIGIGGL